MLMHGQAAVCIGAMLQGLFGTSIVLSSGKLQCIVCVAAHART
jgi:hypothetical protein